MSKRRNHDAAFKARVALEAVNADAQSQPISLLLTAGNVGLQLSGHPAA